MKTKALVSLLTIGAIAVLAKGADRDQRTEIPTAVQRTVSFSKEVLPLLTARCGSCHMNAKKSGGLRMDSRELLLQGGDSGPVIALGKSGESHLIRLVAALNPDQRMPPQGPILSNEHVGILRAWIDQGLKWEETVASGKKPEELTAAEAEAAGLCPVQKNPSKLVYHTTVGGQTYHFCCPECKKAFVANPAKYGANAELGTRSAERFPLVPPSSALASSALAQRIDDHLDKRLAEKEIPPSAPSDDAEFLRRIYLDLHGVIPPADKVVAFLKNGDAAKRSKVIDELLADGQYARHMADVWDHLLVARNTPGCEPAVAPLTDYLEKTFQDNVPWDQLVRDLLTSSGTQKENGAVTYFFANRTTPMVVDSATRVFLGMPLECAQCHDHPYTRWEQTDYWGFAAFFNGLNRGGVDKYGIIQIDSVRPLVEQRGRLQASLPPPPGNERQKTKGANIPIRLLGEEPLRLGKDEQFLSRPLAAKWLTASDNPYFARAMVNRVWWQFFGRGLVNPVDDMFKPEATATHLELLDELTAQFVASKFDVKHLVRAITTSRAYQRTSKPLKENAGDREFYSHMSIRVLTPEQLWDSLVMVFGQEPAMPAGKLGRPLLVLREGMPTTPRGEFVRYFLEEHAAPTDFTQGIPHALRLLNGVQFNNVDTSLERIVPKGTDAAKAIESLYLATLSRRPTETEIGFMTTYLQRHNDLKSAYEDVLWALLKSSEFVMNH